MVHGAGFPVLSIVLGGMTNVFIRAQVGIIGANDTQLLDGNLTDSYVNMPEMLRPIRM